MCGGEGERVHVEWRDMAKRIPGQVKMQHDLRGKEPDPVGALSREGRGKKENLRSRSNLIPSLSAPQIFFIL